MMKVLQLAPNTGSCLLYAIGDNHRLPHLDQPLVRAQTQTTAAPAHTSETTSKSTAVNWKGTAGKGMSTHAASLIVNSYNKETLPHTYSACWQETVQSLLAALLVRLRITVGFEIFRKWFAEKQDLGDLEKGCEREKGDQNEVINCSLRCTLCLSYLKNAPNSCLSFLS
jgi:hypothetical protein